MFDIISGCADEYNLIELCDLIGFGYDLSDTQDELKCQRIQVSDQWSMGPLVI